MEPAPLPLPHKPGETDPYAEKQQIFLMYTLFCGDAIKTGHALGMPPASIVAIAAREGWDKKVSELQALRNSDKPGDLERALNRAINYVQAHAYRAQVERVIAEMRSWSDEELRSKLIMRSVDKAGEIHEHLSCRAFADLASALEKAHAMSYLALNDTAQDRARRKEETNESVLSATALHTQIAAAMASIPLESPKSQLLDAQQKLADELVDLKEFGKRMVNDPRDEPEEEPPLTFNVPELK